MENTTVDISKETTPPISPLRTVYNNACSNVPTKFLTGAELIKIGTKVYNIENENWTYPILSFGDSESNYYGELWMNGMDYNYTYWIIEQTNYDTPEPLPLLHFDDTDQRSKFNSRDFNAMCKSFMYNRRYECSKKIKGVTYENRYGFYRDDTWPCFRIMYKDGEQRHIFKTTRLAEKYGTEGEAVYPTLEGVEVLSEKRPEWVKCVFGHASQKDSIFYVNRLFLEALINE